MCKNLGGQKELIDIKNYGFIGNTELKNGLIIGRITEQQKDHYRVMCCHGDVYAFLKGSFIYTADIRGDLPCVGDFVEMRYNDSGPSVIEKMLPRRTKFSRANFLGHAVGYVKSVYEQVVSANFDYVFILSSLNLDFNANRIERYIIQARQSGGKPVVILTKADLVENYDKQINEIKNIASDVDVYAISAHNGYGMESLNNYLAPAKTIVFLGMSGVGKSSLLNALMQSEVMETKEIRENDAKGRHTTTHRQLFMLDCGAMVIDTPGMRELGLYDAIDGVSENFTDIEELFLQCRFSDCKHRSEPGCAVKAALRNGTLLQKRWDNYNVQLKESLFVKRREVVQTIRDEKNKKRAENSSKKKVRRNERFELDEE